MERQRFLLHRKPGRLVQHESRPDDRRLRRLWERLLMPELFARRAMKNLSTPIGLGTKQRVVNARGLSHSPTERNRVIERLPKRKSQNGAFGTGLLGDTPPHHLITSDTLLCDIRFGGRCWHMAPRVARRPCVHARMRRFADRNHPALERMS